MSQLLIEKPTDAKNLRALVLVRNVPIGITLSTLIYALLALRVVGESDRGVVKESHALFEIAPVDEVVHQVAQLCDQVAITAQRLVITLATVLLSALM